MCLRRSVKFLMTRSDLNQEYLADCFEYDQSSGVLTWKLRPREHFATPQCYARQLPLVGKPAGTDSCGYVQVKLNRKTWKAHRLIWLLVYGRWPERVLDHINRNKSDNRLCNLRECTDSQNAHASPGRKNKYGLRGVSRVRNKWRACISISGVTETIGSTFKTKEDAALAYALVSVDRLGRFAPEEARALFNEAYP